MTSAASGLQRLADAVDLLVDLGSVVVSSLTGARHLEGNSRRVPGANARHLRQIGGSSKKIELEMSEFQCDLLGFPVET